VGGAEHVTFRFFLREPTEWAPTDHEVAWQQLELRPPPRPSRARGRAARDGLARFDDLILDGPRLQLWRAATDNDGLRLMPERPAGRLPRWLELGLDRLEHREESPGVVRASGRGEWDDAVHRQTFRELDSGAILVENEVVIGPELRDLPRVGVVLVLRPGLERLEWLGRGPWENYVDRRASAVVGRYESTVAEQYVPYILPQEHGHRSDGRRLA